MERCDIVLDFYCSSNWDNKHGVPITRDTYISQILSLNIEFARIFSKLILRLFEVLRWCQILHSQWISVIYTSSMADITIATKGDTKTSNVYQHKIIGSENMLSFCLVISRLISYIMTSWINISAVLCKFWTIKLYQHNSQGGTPKLWKYLQMPETIFNTFKFYSNLLFFTSVWPNSSIKLVSII